MGVLDAAARRGALVQQRRAMQLGRVNPIPMPRDILALRQALFDRERRLERKHAQYESGCPPLNKESMMLGLERLEPMVWGGRQKQMRQVLQELMIAENPRTVNDAIVHNRDTYRIGRRALRMAGDIDSEISWIVGHYLCGVITRVELTAHGSSAFIRRYRYALACMVLVGLAVYSHFKREIDTTVQTIQDTVKQIPEANPFKEKPEPPPLPPGPPRHTGSVLACALPATLATFVFGPPGAVGAAGATAVVLLLGSIEEQD